MGEDQLSFHPAGLSRRGQRGCRLAGMERGLFPRHPAHKFCARPEACRAGGWKGSASTSPPRARKERHKEMQ
ncbi:hypothetical protein SUGI_0449430 [Cryptomeria japonica]|nr:hypothetical protein SUGI_0449430 [Cryptomeria japonica]